MEYYSKCGRVGMTSVAVGAVGSVDSKLRCPRFPQRSHPTTERLLKAFGNITLTIVHLPGQVVHHVTPLTPVQTRILELLGLSPTIYTALVTN